MTPVIATAALVGMLGYGWAVRADRLGHWPRRRSVLWVLGLLALLLAGAGPLAESADHDFTAHMLTHLLLGMLAPLLLVLAAPVTLALRALPVRRGRQLARVLARPPFRVLTDPVVAAVLSVGGLWVLYTSSLFSLMHAHPLIHVLVHLHVLTSGLLFTVAVISVDPLPHRRRYPVRAAVLIGAAAGHAILAKYLYLHPPDGVVNAEVGAMTMYYGGDAVEIALVVVLCSRWYTAVGREWGRTVRTPAAISGAAGAAPRD